MKKEEKYIKIIIFVHNVINSNNIYNMILIKNVNYVELVFVINVLIKNYQIIDLKAVMIVIKKQQNINVSVEIFIQMKNSENVINVIK
jgi:hypothetical protein